MEYVISILIGFFLYDFIVGRGMSKWRVNVLAAILTGFASAVFSLSFLWIFLVAIISLLIAESVVKAEHNRGFARIYYENQTRWRNEE